MNTQDLKDQLALDLGDTTAKLTVRDLIVRGEIETPRASVRKPKPAPTFDPATVYEGAFFAIGGEIDRQHPHGHGVTHGARIRPST